MNSFTGVWSPCCSVRVVRTRKSTSSTSVRQRGYQTGSTGFMRWISTLGSKSNISTHDTSLSSAKQKEQDEADRRSQAQRDETARKRRSKEESQRKKRELEMLKQQEREARAAAEKARAKTLRAEKQRRKRENFQCRPCCREHSVPKIERSITRPVLQSH